MSTLSKEYYYQSTVIFRPEVRSLLALPVTCQQVRRHHCSLNTAGRYFEHAGGGKASSAASGRLSVRRAGHRVTFWGSRPSVTRYLNKAEVRVRTRRYALRTSGLKITVPQPFQNSPNVPPSTATSRPRSSLSSYLCLCRK